MVIITSRGFTPGISLRNRLREMGMMWLEDEPNSPSLSMQYADTLRFVQSASRARMFAPRWQQQPPNELSRRF